MVELRVDPEFRGQIPPMSPEEFFQLRENILEAGEVYDPIITWRGIIVDGHNRWRIIQENPEIKYKTREMDFVDKWEAFEWMYKNQLGRRNLTDSRRAYLWGKLQEARKQSRGTNRYTSDKMAHSEPSTAEEIAKEVGVSRETIKRAERFAQGVDAIREKEPEIADKILLEELTPKRKDVMAIAKADPEERPRMIEQIKSGQRVTPVEVPDKIEAPQRTSYNGGGTKEYRADREEIAQIVSSMYSETAELTLDGLLDEIRLNTERFFRSLQGIIEGYNGIAVANMDKIHQAIQENVKKEMDKMKEEQ